MASKGKIEREKKVAALVAKYEAKRKELKAKIKDLTIEPKERAKFMFLLSGLPRSSSKVRKRNRCSITGTAGGHDRRTGLRRFTFRKLAREGLIPDVIRASW